MNRFGTKGFCIFRDIITFFPTIIFRFRAGQIDSVTESVKIAAVSALHPSKVIKSENPRRNMLLSDVSNKMFQIKMSSKRKTERRECSW